MKLKLNVNHHKSIRSLCNIHLYVWVCESHRVLSKTMPLVDSDPSFAIISAKMGLGRASMGMDKHV